MKAAIDARVSGDKQREEQTIESQRSELLEWATELGLAVPDEWQFLDDGYSGGALVRPALERLRDLVAEGVIELVLIYSPDRLAREYAHQVLLLEEFRQAGADARFRRAPSGQTPEDQLVVQFQGMIAQYEPAQILERTRRGKRHKALRGVSNVLSGAPYGFRYVPRTDTCDARYEVPSYCVPRLVQDVTPVDAVVQRMESPTRLSLGHIPQSTLKASHVFAGTSPVGVVGTLGVHALARSFSVDTTTPGTPPSGRVVLHGHRRCIGPLGLPLRSARLRLGLIRATLP